MLMMIHPLKDETYVEGMMVRTWTLEKVEFFEDWMYTYNGNEAKRSLLYSNLSKWFHHYN